MNANELADWIEDDSVVDIMLTSQEHYRNLVATMLRQQQAEIEAYKLELYNEVQLRKEQNGIYKKQIEDMGLAIVDSGYVWTPAMRSAWEALDKEPK